MKSKYGLGQCWLCLCDVCTRHNCPKLNRRYLLRFCTTMIMRERCPVIKCDWFCHKEKHKVFRIVRRERKRDELLEKLTSLQEKLDRLLEKM